MDSLIKFLLVSGDKISLVGVLSAGFALTVTAFFRQWLIIGPTFKREVAEREKCEKENAEFRRLATERAQANEVKVGQLEQRVKELLDDREHRRRGQ